MKRIKQTIFSLTLLLNFSFSKAQSPTFDWAFKVSSTWGDEAYSFDIDPSGHSILCGAFQSSADFDPSTGSFPLSPGSVNRDIFVARYDSNKVFKWAFKIGGTLDDYAYANLADPYGNFYLTGTFTGQNIDFDPGAGVFALSTPTNVNSFYFAKYDTAKVLKWAFKLGNDSNQVTGQKLLFDNSGNIIVTGKFTKTLDFDPSPTNTYTLSSYQISPFIAKYDTAGNFLWAFAIDGTDYENIEGVTKDGSGNLYVSGYYNGTIDTDPSPATYNLTNFGAFVAKYDQAGNFIWAKSLLSTIVIKGFDIKYSNNNIYFVGEFYGTMDADAGAGVFNLTSNTAMGTHDAFVAKYDLQGNFIWAFDINQAHIYFPLKLAFDNAGNIVVGGGFWGTTDFNPSASTFNMTSSSSFNNVYFAAYDQNKTFKWASKIGGNDQIYLECMKFTPNNKLYASGQFWKTVDFDPSASTFNLATPSTSNYSDLFFAKYNGNGIPTGINEQDGSNYISVYPNPATQNIYTKGISVNSVIRLYDIVGNLIFEKKISNDCMINVEHLSSGMYSLTIENESNTIYKKIVVSN